MGQKPYLYLSYWTKYKSISVEQEGQNNRTQLTAGAYPGGMHRMHVHPPSPPCASPPRPCASPPQPERLVMRKDEAVGNKKKMQVCLPKHNYKLDNNLLKVEPRAVDPHCFDADPDPAQTLDADPDPDPDPGGEGGG
jgi:hypothetical protein